MARKGTGVSVYPSGIRIRITVRGTTVNETVKIKGVVAQPTAANQRYATRLADTIRRRLEAGTYNRAEFFGETTDRADSLATYFEHWLKTLIDVTPATLRGYTTAIESFWKPQLGKTPLSSIRRSDILTALGERPKWTGKTRNNKMSVLRQALDMAVSDGLLLSNPCNGIDAFSHQKPPVDPFTAEERDAILLHFERHAPEVVWNYFAAMFWTGLRTSEGLGLAWTEVDLRNRSVTILQGLVEGQMTDRTKTARIRAVDLNPWALEALQRQAKHTRLAGEIVFTHPATGKAWEREQQTWAIWKRALGVLGIRYRRPYNTRHTYATALIMAGLKPSYIASQLGHSVPVLLDRYAKWLDGTDNAREQAKLVDFLKESKNAQHRVDRPRRVGGAAVRAVKRDGRDGDDE